MLIATHRVPYFFEKAVFSESWKKFIGENKNVGFQNELRPGFPFGRKASVYFFHLLFIIVII